MKPKKFKPGSVVLFDPTNFNPDFWNGLSEEQRIKSYGGVGYGEEKLHLFVYMCAIYDCLGEDTGHCVLISMRDQHIETMRHTTDFRLAGEDEF